jgi:hypothetical protein
MSAVETTLSEIIADNIRNGKCRVISFKEFESWCDGDEKQQSLPVRLVKKVLVTFKLFIIKIRKLIFKF